MGRSSGPRPLLPRIRPYRLCRIVARRRVVRANRCVWRVFLPAIDPCTGPWWVLLLCTAFLLSAPVLAQDEDPTPKQQLADIDASLKDVERKRGDAEATETLAMLSEYASQARRDAEALEKALQPQLDRLNEQLVQLGTPAEGPLSRRSWRQRRTLTKQRDGLAASVVQAKATAVRAQQLATDIEQQRTAQRTEELGQKVASPLSPALWSRWPSACRSISPVLRRWPSRDAMRWPPASAAMDGARRCWACWLRW